MNPWISVMLVSAGIVFLLDLIVRRKKWKDNTKTEKISLLLNMFSVVIYAFSSVLGVFWGIAGGSPDTAFGKLFYDVTLKILACNGIVSIVAIVGSFILRKRGKAKTSILLNLLAMAYMIILFITNYFAGAVL